jgi:hypothetical protein
MREFLHRCFQRPSHQQAGRQPECESSHIHNGNDRASCYTLDWSTSAMLPQRVNWLGANRIDVVLAVTAWSGLLKQTVRVSLRGVAHKQSLPNNLAVPLLSITSDEQHNGDMLHGHEVLCAPVDDFFKLRLGRTKARAEPFTLMFEQTRYLVCSLQGFRMRGRPSMQCTDRHGPKIWPRTIQGSKEHHIVTFAT